MPSTVRTPPLMNRTANHKARLLLSPVFGLVVSPVFGLVVPLPVFGLVVSPVLGLLSLGVVVVVLDFQVAS